MLSDLIPAAVVSVAAVCDVRWRKIPNWLTLSALVGGVVLQTAHFGLIGVQIALAGAALGLCMLLPFYVIHAMGAGDVKLLAALGALVGPQALVSLATYAALAGGVISFVILARRGKLRFSISQIMTRPTPQTQRTKAPYGVAIACGVYLSLVLPSVIG
jgi:prepilin peptidase CpaA